MLLDGISNYPGWMEDAECRDTELNPFDPKQQAKFAELCKSCPVLEDCQAMIEDLEEEPTDGVFGGVIYGEE